MLFNSRLIRHLYFAKLSIMKWMAFIAMVFVATTVVTAQRVGIGTTTPDPSSVLDVKSTNKGILIPRMSTAQRKSILNPEESLMVYDTTTKNYWFYSEGWKCLASNSMVSDSAFIIGKQAGTIPQIYISNQALTDSSGYIYDLGGPAGNYFNNENGNCLVAIANAALVRVQIISNNLEFPYDSLKIITQYGKHYFVGNQTDTLYIQGYFTILFKTNAVNTMAGFVIRVDGMYDYNPEVVVQPPMSGLYFIPEKKH